MKMTLLSYGSKMENIGDAMQRMGLICALKKCNVDIQKLEYECAFELNHPKDDRAFITYGYFDYTFGQNMFPLDSHEYPVFIGMHCTDEKRIKELLELEREPLFFGCRDYATYVELKKNFEDIPIFISGCYYLIQEKRLKEPIEPKVYMVDVEPKLLPYIPKEYLDNAVYKTHVLPSFDKNNNDADDKAYEYLKNWTKELKENAQLLITSRLHCALPCVAMGIPVIVARKYEDNTDRYAGYEKFFHVYMPDEYDKIDWHPLPYDLEWIKEDIIKNTKDIVDMIEKDEFLDKNAMNSYAKKWQRVHEFFMQNTYCPYNVGRNISYLSHKSKLEYLKTKDNYNGILHYITGKNPKNKELIIYGAGDKGLLLRNRFEKEMARFKDIKYIDGNPKKWGKYTGGYKIFSPEYLKNRQDDVIVIVAINVYYKKAGREISAMLANEYDYVEGRDFLMLDKLDSSAKYEMEDFVLSAPLM